MEEGTERARTKMRMSGTWTQRRARGALDLSWWKLRHGYRRTYAAIAWLNSCFKQSKEDGAFQCCSFHTSHKLPLEKKNVWADSLKWRASVGASTEIYFCVCQTFTHASVSAVHTYELVGGFLQTEGGDGCLLRAAVNVDLLEDLKMNWC